MTDEIKPFRLAFREEGDFVNCYMAFIDSMKDAILLASVRAKVLRADPEMFGEYQELMKRWATAACNDMFGAGPTEFIVEVAPEHERSGRA